jgi:hypothetical protein
MASLAQINIKFSADLRQFSSEMQTVARDLKRTGEQMQQIGGAMAVGFTLPILAAGAASVKMASDYEESMNKVNVAFGPSNESVKEFAKNSLESFGIAEGTALDMAALFGDMATSMGLPQQEAANLSTSLVGLAGDLASFKNIGIEQATTALNGVFTGETESLKLLGIVMTEANLAQFALTQGITKSIKEMTQAEKVQLRYAFVMSKTTNAQGDFERTGGGAANQMRVFQERLKELGNQFGQIILPAFTKLITSLNGAFKSFSTLSEGTKTTIVVIAALVAAVGPLLLVMGAILQAAPLIIVAFAGIKTAFASFTAVLAANPLTALIIGITALVAGIYAYTKATNGAVNSTKLYNEVRENAAKSIAKERAELDTLLKIAKDETLSKQQRESAIKRMNEISPDYLGNLKLETINTNEAKKAIDAYNVSLNQRALQQSVLAKKTELFNKLIEKQQEDLNRTGNSIKDASQNASDYIFSLLGVETAVINNREELEKYIKTSKLNNEQAKALRKVYEPMIATREKDIKNIQDQIDALDKFNTAEGNAVLSTDAATNALQNLNAEKEKSLKVGTIAYYENEISKLKQLQNEVATTATKYALIQNEINKLQKNIDTLSTPLLEVPSIATTEIDIKLSEGGLSLLESANAAIGEFATNYEATKETIMAANQAIADQAVMVGQAVGDAFAGLSDRYIDSLGLAENGLEGFAKVMLQTVTKLLAMALSNAIANSIVGATQSGNATGPGAVFATPAFIATAVAGILGAFAAIPKFETGGVVGGSSFYGDKILARVNSGELILNNKQQQALSGMLDNTSAMVNVGVSDIVIDGDKLRIIMDRNATKNNRRK